MSEPNESPFRRRAVHHSSQKVPFFGPGGICIPTPLILDERVVGFEPP
jgi:hypothetical protein